MGGRCDDAVSFGGDTMLSLLPAYPAMPMLCFICKAAFSASQ